MGVLRKKQARLLHGRPALLGALTIVAFGLASAPAVAQEVPEFEKLTLETYEGGDPNSNILGVETTDVPAHLAPTADVTIHRSERPLAWRGVNGTIELADDRYTVDLGIGLGLFERLLLDARLTTVVSQTGRGIGSPGTVPSYGSGDLRLRLKARIFETGGLVPIGASIQGAAYAPTGEARGFLSDGAWRFEPRASIDAAAGPVTFAANLAYQSRSRRVVGNNYIYDDALRWGVATRLPLAHGLGIDGSIYGSSIVGAGPQGSVARPIEAMAGFHFRYAGLHIGLAAGGAVTDGVGAPRHRMLGTISYTPERDDEIAGREIGPLDSDRDAIANRFDRCPRAAETYDGFEDRDGCPDEDDDNDGVLDLVDACPGQPGDAAKWGCPLVDLDADGVDDSEDRCPEERGSPAFFGCNRAPMRRINMSPPRARAESAADVEMIDVVEQIPEAVFFGTANAEFKPNEHPLVGRLAERMKIDASITRLVIEGHTDSRGDDEMNRALGADRAKTVYDVLIRRGIPAERLEIMSYGESRPLDDNATEQGRSRNRRVAFRLLRRVPAHEERKVEMTLDHFAIEQRFRLDQSTVLDGARLSAPVGWRCSSSEAAMEREFDVRVKSAPEIEGMLYPGWSSKVELTCSSGDQVATVPVDVEIPSFAIASARMVGEVVVVSRTSPSTMVVKLAHPMPGLGVDAPGLGSEFVPTSRDSARIRLEPQNPDEARYVSVGSEGRPLLLIPIELVADEAPEIDPPPRRHLEIAVGTSVLAAGRSVAEPRERATALPSVQFSGRRLANRWFSIGLTADIGPTLGLDPIMFTPGLGAHVVFHAPLPTVRPFVSGGAGVWFPGLIHARPAFDLSTGIDFEASPGAGVRLGGRLLTMSFDGEPVYLGGGTLSAYTSF